MSSPASRRVLYVDDDPILARLIERTLARAGMELVHAIDADTAERLLAEESFCAVVLDHYLAVGTGLAILQGIRARGARPPVIYVTGSSEATIAIAALKAGADDYVLKTASEDFFPLLARAIDHAIAKLDLQDAKDRADAEVRAARERAEMLLAEVHHRVANSLAMVKSLLRLQASASASEEVRTALAEAQIRIAAVAGVHRSLYLGEDVRAVELEAYLTTMLTDFARTVPPSIRLTIDAAPVRISADRAVCLGVMVSELVTNAVKYAWPTGGEGALRVELTEDAPGQARLEVSDDGVGIDPTLVAQGTGLGQRLLRAMGEQLGGTVEQLPTEKGARIVIRFETDAV
ncbi:response regulator [Cereibacter changlensis]|uniref:histidine kinase n=1 Tax=Cereibacter changlensis TaxID=402884 RepID=A0A4U0YYV3_9RHOB|nr:histidine kinase dimerization/phosphoacceptor domain -containing protein [Cereibacter changlensis]TKA95161.1 response regulator [Cereibacter changlensis]